MAKITNFYFKITDHLKVCTYSNFLHLVFGFLAYIKKGKVQTHFSKYYQY